MTDSEAMTLLGTARDKKVSSKEADDAGKLLKELQWLPLAISQAAAYMRTTRRTLREYLWKLADHKKRRKVLKESQDDRYRRRQVSNSILETWDISMEHIRQENGMAYNILHVMAFLDSQNIPLEIIMKAAALCKAKLADDGQGNESARSVSSGSDSEDDEDEALQAAARLEDFSFLHLHASEDTNRAYEMHKLVQEAAQYVLSRRDRRKDEAYFSRVALRAVIDLFPERRRELWEECEKYVVHAQRAGEWAELCEEEIKASGLLTHVSDYMFDRGRWREKETTVDERALAFRQKKLGARHPDTIRSMAELAVTYHAQGKYDEAEKISVEVLSLRRDILGERHPNTIQSMASLAATYHAQGKYDEDERISVEVLALRREILGERHLDTIWSMADLAITYYSRQRRSEAVAMMEECFQLFCEVLGANHPTTRARLHTLKSWKSRA